MCRSAGISPMACTLGKSSTIELHLQHLLSILLSLSALLISFLWAWILTDCSGCCKASYWYWTGVWSKYYSREVVFEVWIFFFKSPEYWGGVQKGVSQDQVCRMNCLDRMKNAAWSEGKATAGSGSGGCRAEPGQHRWWSRPTDCIVCMAPPGCTDRQPWWKLNQRGLYWE